MTKCLFHRIEENLWRGRTDRVERHFFAGSVTSKNCNGYGHRQRLSVMHSPRTWSTSQMMPTVEEKANNDRRTTESKSWHRFLICWVRVGLQFFKFLLEIWSCATCVLFGSLSLTNQQKSLEFGTANSSFLLRRREHSSYNKLVVQDETKLNLEVLPTKIAELMLAAEQSTTSTGRPSQYLLTEGHAFGGSPSKRFSISAVIAGESVYSKRIIDLFSSPHWRIALFQPIHLDNILQKLDNARPHYFRCVKDFFWSRGISWRSSRVLRPWHKPMRAFPLQLDGGGFVELQLQGLRRSSIGRVAVDKKLFKRRSPAGSAETRWPLVGCEWIVREMCILLMTTNRNKITAKFRYKKSHVF